MKKKELSSPCIWTKCYKEYTSEEALERLADAGFRAIDLGGFYHLQQLQAVGINQAHSAIAIPHVRVMNARIFQ
jgi:sugar phosphate isomerase/epimerase